MAKKTVASLKLGKSQEFTKVIKMERSKKSGAYIFKEDMVNSDKVKDFFAKK
ncbi:MAG: DUF4295 domain-containing protein [Bacteroidota bacterium]|nr:DUF4295 domain-containing protein [Bacteroidota bacterium]